AATIQRLARNVRLVFDYLRMTQLPPPSGVPPGADGLERIRRGLPGRPLVVAGKVAYYLNNESYASWYSIRYNNNRGRHIHR
ncbi:MAG: hypothetical protein KBE53_05435, partial [Chromatiaceae bacterium]|nr:hypothetical protein [Chromatiaceae bacterium]